MIKITKEIIEEHGINSEEYDFILESLSREPTITELGIFSAMWSEHCSYKSSKYWLSQLPTKNEFVIQGPGENAGIVDIGVGYCIIGYLVGAIVGGGVKGREGEGSGASPQPRSYSPSS